MTKKTLLLAVFAAFLASCASKQGEDAPASAPYEREERIATEESGEAAGLDDDLDQSEAKAVPVSVLVDSNNQFALDVLKHVEGGDIAYSPYAISMAGQMLQSGASGATQQQLRDALRLQMSEDVIDTKVQTLRQNLEPSEARGFKVGLDAQLWMSSNIAVRGEWAQRVANTFGMNLEAGPMANDDASRKRIDETVSAASVNAIPNVTRGYDLGDGKVALTLATAPSGAWAVPFERARTAEAIFTNRDGSKGRRAVMRGNGRFGYWEDGTMQVVGLPYAGNATAVIVLPRDGTFSEVETALSHHKLQFIFSNLRQNEVAVTLPKFEVRTSLDVIPMLKSMGVEAAFSDQAEFGVAMGPDSTAVDLFVHETLFSIDEDGTRAQARTVQRARGGSAKQFEATRPFLMFVRHNTTGQILIVARVT